MRAFGADYSMTTSTSPVPTVSPAANSAQIDANKLVGQSIQNSADNATIGKVDSVMLDASGKVDKVIVGVNEFVQQDEPPIEILYIDESAATTQLAKLEALRRSRDNGRV